MNRIVLSLLEYSFIILHIIAENFHVARVIWIKIIICHICPLEFCSRLLSNMLYNSNFFPLILSFE